MFCYYCGILEHDLRHCASHYAVEKQGVGVDYQYDDWLKATRGQQRSRPQRSTVEPNLAGMDEEYKRESRSGY